MLWNWIDSAKRFWAGRVADGRAFVASFSQRVAVDRDPRYAAEARRANEFQQKELSESARRILLDHAERKYSERCAGFELLDKKREWLISFSMGATTFLVGAQQLATRPPTATSQFFISLAVACLLVAMVIMLLSRLMVVFPVRFTIQELREGLSHESMTQPEDWMAASLHKTSEAIRVYEEIVAMHYNAAARVVIVAVFLLLIAIVCPARQESHKLHPASSAPKNAQHLVPAAAGPAGAAALPAKEPMVDLLHSQP